jgi:hypothetical protein
MFDDYVFLKSVDVIDKDLFTEEVADKWKAHMLNSYEDVFHGIRERIDPISSIKFFVSKSLIEEVIVDAIIGLQKITNSKTHTVRFPNTFKVAAYLAYWWLRHKPVSIHYPNGYFLENVQIHSKKGQDAETIEKDRQKTIWRLKHINELIAVQIVMSFIFRFDKVVCSRKECKRVGKSDKNFSFDDFEVMKTVILQKLTYYFSYRPITPKVIEHILEGYTFHPAWGLTGKQWATEEGVT